MGEMVDETSSLSVIMPAYNERHAIESVVEDLASTLEESGLEYEIIVVDDGSEDGTGQIIDGLPVRVIRHHRNRGYGASLKTGIRHASYSMIAITDSDGTYPVDSLPKLAGKMDSCDMVVGARTGDRVKVPLIRRPAKWLLNKTAHILSGEEIPDLNSGLRVFRRELAERFLSVCPDGFSFTSTLTVAALTNGYRVRFLPIDYHRRRGTSSIRPIRDTLGFFTLVLRLVVYFRPLNVFLPISGLLILAGTIKGLIDFTRYNRFGTGVAIAIMAGIQVALLGLLADLIRHRTDL